MLKFARNPKEIAKVLGIVLPRQRNRLKAKLSEINGWRAEPGFPAYQKGKGYPALEVFTFGQQKARAVAPEKAKQAAVAEILGSEKPTRAALKALGSEDRGQRTEDRGRPFNTGPIPSQSAMAVELQLRYKLPINRQTVCNWIHGIQLPSGAPCFPLPDPGGNRWNNPKPCYEWYEKWIVEPTTAAFAGKDAQGNLFEQKRADSVIAAFDEQIEKARKIKIETDAAERANSDKWVRYAAVSGYFSGAVQQICAHYDKLIEDKTGLRRVVLGIIGKMFSPTPEQLMALDAQLTTEFPREADELKRTFESIGQELETRLTELRRKDGN